MLNRGLTRGKSLISTKNNRGPRIEPCGALVSITLVDDIEPLKIIVNNMHRQHSNKHIPLKKKCEAQFTAIHCIAFTNFVFECET